MKDNVIVTGGAGFIGSHVCKELNDNGFYPIVVDDLSTGHEAFVKWGHLETFSIHNNIRLTKLFQNSNPIAVIHLAASAYVGESVINPELYYQNNVLGMMSLLSVIKNNNLCPIIFSSSCATYGQPDIQPITEDTPRNPINVYGRTKLICEWMLEDFYKAYNLPFIALRYFNAAGADHDGILFENHHPETHLIPRAIEASTIPGSNLEIFGNNHSTEDGTCVRDYIHVSDLADAHVKALKKLLKDNQSGYYNLGSGIGVSVNEIIEQIYSVTGNSVPYNFTSKRPGDPPILIADPKKAKIELAFDPKRSTIQNIIKTAAIAFSRGLGNE